MMNLPSQQTVSPLGQLAPNVQSPGVPQINPTLLDAIKKFLEAQMMANGGSPAAAGPQGTMQQPQAPPPNTTNPGMGRLTFPNMNPANTGMTPQFGAQIGGALKKGLLGQ